MCCKCSTHHIESPYTNCRNIYLHNGKKRKGETSEWLVSRPSSEIWRQGFYWEDFFLTIVYIICSFFENWFRIPLMEVHQKHRKKMCNIETFICHWYELWDNYFFRFFVVNFTTRTVLNSLETLNWYYMSMSKIILMTSQLLRRTWLLHTFVSFNSLYISMHHTYCLLREQSSKCM